MNFSLDMADVKPSLVSFVTVGLMASLFILLGKWASNRWAVPVIRDYFNSI